MNKSNDFYNTTLEEQETTINVDYFKKTLFIYTSRSAVYERLVKSIGEPTLTYRIDEKITGEIWTVPFSDKKKANVVFSKTKIVGQC